MKQVCVLYQGWERIFSECLGMVDRKLQYSFNSFETVRQELVLNVNYTRTRTNVKQPSQILEATLGYVNMGVVYPKRSYKITLPVNNGSLNYSGTFPKISVPQPVLCCVM